MRFAVTLIVWISDTPLDSLDATVVGVLSALTSAAYPFTDNPINAKPTSIDIRCLICCLIPNASLNTYIYSHNYINYIFVLLHIYLDRTKPIPLPLLHSRGIVSLIHIKIFVYNLIHN